ncbi:MAG TPA: pyrroline-5-carboxylate reductase, partial [Stellaceae bacterium]|nr:pyrroline-5-carboxylate reductase [Stellaceae bacterium]
MNEAILLVGGGKMGAALLKGWRERGRERRIIIVEPNPAFEAPPATELHRAPATLPKDLKPSLVVLAVKPQILGEVLPPYRRFGETSLFLSICAGKTLGFFARHLGPAAAVVRAMPNTPAAIGRAISVACANPHTDETQRALAERALAAVGEVAWVEEEGLIDAVTAVSGSGPAYVFLLIEALAAAGVKAGLPADLAARLARSTVAGAGEL